VSFSLHKGFTYYMQKLPHPTETVTLGMNCSMYKISMNYMLTEAFLDMKCRIGPLDLVLNSFCLV
jgi:hypothetical protein